MSKRANMSMVGLFVIAAIGLGVTATVVLASGALFRDTFTVYSMFDGSVQGLQIGAPVVFRGVQIGTVADIRLMMDGDPRRGDPSNNDPRIPVIYNLDKTLLQSRGSVGEVDEETVRVLVEQGLKAQLVTESFVTGRLLVSLDYRPNQEVVLDGWDVDHPQIPTIPTPIEEIQHQIAGLIDKLEDVDVSTIIQSVESMMNGITDLVSDPEIREVTASLDVTLAELDRTLVSFRETASDLSTDIHGVAESAEERAKQLESVLTEAEATMVAVQQLVSLESPLSVQMAYAMQQFGEAARALRVLTETLEQNPSVLIRGRTSPEGNR